MTKGKLFTTVSITASCFAAWLYIVTQIQPNRHDTFLIAAFFITGIVWFGALLAFLLYKYRVARSNRQVIYAYIRPSVRQGYIISITLAMILFLQMLRVIGAWEVSLVVVVAILFEAALRHSNHNTEKASYG